MAELGAKTFYPRAEADDATGYVKVMATGPCVTLLKTPFFRLEEVVEPWKKGLVPAVKALLEKLTNHHASEGEGELKKWQAAEPAATAPVSTPTPSTTPIPTATTPSTTAGGDGGAKPAPKKKIVIKRQGTPDLPPCTLAVTFHSKGETLPQPTTKEADRGEDASLFSQDRPFLSPLLGARRLTALDADKTTLELEIGTEGANVAWLPGDAFAIICHNPPDVVDKVIAHLGLDPEAIFTLSPNIESGNASLS